MYYVYILYSKKFSRTYTGQTQDIKNRLKEHNAGKNKSTKHYTPWEILHLEEYSSRNDAVTREKYLKTSIGRRYIKNKFFNSNFSPGS